MNNPTVEAQGLKNILEKLVQISDWFEDQSEIDIEKGIKKVKEAAGLIKAGKARLKGIENEFEEIKKDIEKEVEGM